MRKDVLQQGFKSKLSVLEKQTSDAAAEKEKRLAAAKILAEEAVKEVGPGVYCSPRHLTHFEPSSLELKGTL